MRQKAVLINFRSANNLNAETIASRIFDLQAVNQWLLQFNESQLPALQLPIEHIKPTMNWSVDWDTTNDSKLVVGVWKYGFGSWDQMAVSIFTVIASKQRV